MMTRKKLARIGTICAPVFHFLRIRFCIEGADRSQLPPVDVVARGVLRFRGLPDRPLTREESKPLVLDFYNEFVKKPQRATKPAPELKPAAKVKRVQRAQPCAVPAPPRHTGTDFYWSEEWRRVRYLALRASRGVCELCGAAPVPGKPLHVDHIKPRSKYPELELELSNLQVLCADCNLGKSNIDEIDWRRTEVKLPVYGDPLAGKSAAKQA